MFVPNFKILGQVVHEKFMTKLNVYAHTQSNILPEKAKTKYPNILRIPGAIKISTSSSYNMLCFFL